MTRPVHNLKINCDGASSHSAMIELDGREIFLTALTVEMSVGNLNRVTMVLDGAAIEMNADTEVVAEIVEDSRVDS